MKTGRVNAMNINQIGLASQKTGKEQKSIFGTVQSSESTQQTKPTEPKFVRQSGMINQISKGNGTYGKNGVEDTSKKESTPVSKTALDCLEDVKDRMTEDDVQDLEDEGMSLEKYESQRLDKALNRIKENRQEQRNSIENTVEKRKNQTEDMKETAVKNAVEHGTASQAAAALASANLPVTQDNIDKVTQAVEMSESAGSISDEARQYLISNEMDLTIRNIYQAEYSAGSTAGNTQFSGYVSTNVAYDVDGSSYKNSDADWELIKGQAEGVIESAGMEVNEDTLNQCKWLFENNLPVTKEALKQLNALNAIQENYNSDEVMEQVIKNYETGIQPEDTSLGFFGKQEKDDQVQKFLAQVEAELSSSNSSILDVTQRRQLEEIRLKMTTEVSQKLIEKGIKLDTENLSEIVEGLKQIEQDYYHSMVQEGQADDINGAAELFQETIQKVNGLGAVPESVLGKTFDKRDIQTVNSLYETGISMKAEFEKAGESYEALGTEVRKDLGDSVKKAFAGIDDMLKDMGLEPTEANRRAIRILGYNSIEITKESIAEMKNYDSKVQNLMDGLKPAITLEMIKRGVNPLDTPIDEVNQEIEQISQEIGASEDEKYSEFLWKLDQKKELSTDERKAFIGLYRLMNHISKSDGAAIGSVIKAGKELTLSNLLTAVRTSKSGGVNQSVDDNFGTLESTSRKGESISEQVQYYRREAQSVLNKMTPDNLEQASQSLRIDGQDTMETLQDVSLEMLHETIEQQSDNMDETSKQYLKEKMESYYEKLDNSQECMDFLESADISATLENTASAQTLLYENVWEQVADKTGKKPAEKEKYKESMQKLSESLGEDFFEEEYDSFTELCRSMVKESMYQEDTTSSDMSLYRFMGSSLELTGALSKKESYQMPVVTGDKIANVNVTLEHSSIHQGKVKISYRSDDLGEIESEWTVRGDAVTGAITADNVTALDLLKQQKMTMGDAISEIGLTAEQVNFSLNRNKGIQLSSTENTDESVDTKVLLKVAKTFIKTVQTVEQRKERG